ncbi:MAG TPA: RluA family pseudouridine synthase [Pyrinomonadaceae bacterium]|jgi:23S rRNA pseudouridine1911/1915/1917 synthase|nr:RluA family pseudouridine synthase [Pyrinomonadaceae bacterium]
MDAPRRFLVDGASSGVRLDDFLAARLPSLSRMRIRALVGRGECSVNGGAAQSGRRLAEGDAVEVAPFEESPNAMTPEPLPLEVVHEDEHVVVVVKPAGMLAHPTRGVKRGTLANALSHHLNRSLAGGEWVRPGLVHRLDRATSGLMVVAKTRAALARLSEHFHRRLVEKLYLAVLEGVVEADALVIDAPIGRVAESSPAWGVTGEGKQAETRLRVVERGNGRTLVELEPVTGRTNQLRVHCAHAGHAVVGDPWYAREPYARLCLHAARLAFRHPSTNERLEFFSPPPPEVLRALGERI